MLFITFDSKHFLFYKSLFPIFSSWLSLHVFKIIVTLNTCLKSDHSAFNFKIFLFIYERHTERGGDIGRGRSRLPSGSLMWDLIPGPWDHALSRRQIIKHWAIQASLKDVLRDHLLHFCCLVIEETESRRKEMTFLRLSSSPKLSMLRLPGTLRENFLLTFLQISFGGWWFSTG